MTNSVFSFSATDIWGKQVELRHYEGRVLLIVNVASKCGFTPQYTELEGLQREYGQRGFTVLGFPCNQFGRQEPHPENEIHRFCTTNYNVSFPMFSKIDVNGTNALPLFKWLTAQKPGILGTPRIKWNFTKFLINRKGQVVKRYAPGTSPAKIRDDLVALLDDRV